MGLFMFLFVLYFWYVPESPRFLVIKGKHRQAARIFHRIAISNKRPFDRPRFINDSDDETDSHYDETSHLVNSSDQSVLIKTPQKVTNPNFLEIHFCQAFTISTFENRVLRKNFCWL